MKRAFPGIICFLLLVGAIVICWLGTRELIEAQASHDWPSVEGIITYSEFEYTGTGSNSTRSPVVRYRYMVDGKEYTGERIAFGPIPGDKGGDALFISERDEKIKAFAVIIEGSRIAVYYDTSNPSDAVLLQGGGMFVLIYYFCGALMLGVAFMCFLLATGRIKV